MVLNNDYSTTKLCYKLLDDKYLDENGKIKEKYKFKLNFPEFGIVDSKIPAKENEKFDTYLFLPKSENRKGEGGLRTRGCFKFSYENLIMNDEFLILNDKNDNEFKIDNSTFNIQHSTLNKLPLITIITVVYNGEKYLEETIQSVINQTYPNVEYIIIDGGSTDRTIDIIKKYEDKIDYWVSEKDNGIYDAMNKGIDLAQGEWINFMNAGDKFYDNKVLEKIFVNDNDKFDIIYGNHQVIYPKRTRIAKAGDVKNLWKGSQFSHQSVFIKSKLHKKKKYNIMNKIGADFEFFYNAFLNQYQFKYFDSIISSVSAGGISDIKRIDSIIEWWNVVEKTNKVNVYYLLKVIKEMIKSIIKKCLHYL
jgi:hypothetical protein